MQMQKNHGGYSSKYLTKEAEAQAKANLLLAKSLSTALIRYNAVDKWNGEYPQTLMGGKMDCLILNLPGSTI